MPTDFLQSSYETTANNRSRLDSFVVMPDGQVVEPLTLLGLQNVENKVLDNSILSVVSGSFNPIHEAHKAIYDCIKPMHGNSKKVIPVFEISIHRVHKEPLSFEELKIRLKQFEWYAPVWVTNASLFFEKAGLVCQWIRPSFHIGIDTATRIVEHHGVSGVQGIAADFVVHKRHINGKVFGLQDLIGLYGSSPNNMEEAPIQIDKTFLNVSSTGIRNCSK